VVHRDIKPSNLLLSRDGVVKILDMGLARLSSAEEMSFDADGERLTGRGKVMGTCDYMPPEQIEDTHAADERSDIYSLGCTLYRLLTGHPPYKARHPVRVMMAHMEWPIPSLCAARPDVPPRLDRLFRRMLAKRPEDRPRSMSEVIAELNLCRQEIDATVLPAEPEERLPAQIEPDEDETGLALEQFLRRLEQESSGEQVPTLARAGTDATTRSGLSLFGSAIVAKVTDAWRQHGTRIAMAAACVMALAVGAVAIALHAGRSAGQKVAQVGGPQQAAQAVKQAAATGTREPAGGPARSVPSQQPASQPANAKLSGTSNKTEKGKKNKRPEPSRTQRRWAQVQEQAAELISQGRFGQAEALYRNLFAQVSDSQLRERIAAALKQLQQQAQQAYQSAIAQATKLSSEGQFDEAKKLLNRLIARHGIAAHVAEAKALLRKIEAAERQASIERAKREAALRRKRLEDEFLHAMEPVLQSAAQWNFQAALAQLKRNYWREQELAARQAAWQRVLQHWRT